MDFSANVRMQASWPWCSCYLWPRGFLPLASLRFADDLVPPRFPNWFGIWYTATVTGGSTISHGSLPASHFLLLHVLHWSCVRRNFAFTRHSSQMVFLAPGAILAAWLSDFPPAARTPRWFIHSRCFQKSLYFGGRQLRPDCWATRWKLRTVNMRPALWLRHIQPSPATLQKDVNSCFTMPRLACHSTDMDGISPILKLKNCGEKMLMLRIDKRGISLELFSLRWCLPHCNKLKHKTRV